MVWQDVNMDGRYECCKSSALILDFEFSNVIIPLGLRTLNCIKLCQGGVSHCFTASGL